MTNKLDRPSIIYRVMIVRAPKSVGPVLTSHSNLDPFEDTQLDNVGNALLHKIDTDRGFKAYYDKIHRHEVGCNLTGGAAKECHIMKRIWLKRKNARPIIFNSNAATIVNSPLMLYIYLFAAE